MLRNDSLCLSLTGRVLMKGYSSPKVDSRRIFYVIGSSVEWRLERKRKFWVAPVRALNVIVCMACSAVPAQQPKCSSHSSYSEYSASVKSRKLGFQSIFGMKTAWDNIFHSLGGYVRIVVYSNLSKNLRGKMYPPWIGIITQAHGDCLDMLSSM